MRLRNVPGAREAIAESECCINEPEKYKGSWCRDIFHNDHPLHIEIGMGKGDFIVTLAAQNPDINYIGIEKFSSVLIRAIEKVDAVLADQASGSGAVAGADDGLSGTSVTECAESNDTSYGIRSEGETRYSNLYFIRFDAEHITDIFGEGEVDRIYLNFSDPWPKDRHAKRRLTSPRFLSLYDRILAGDGYIQFKTDNRALFDYSVEVVEQTDCPEDSLPAADQTHWHIDEITYDLHHSEQSEGNVMTEYEKKFVALGHPICRFVISRR